MLLALRAIKLMSYIICVSLLSQCANVTALPVPNVHPRIVSPYTMSAAAYLALANNQSGSEHQVLMMKAAGRLIDDGQWREGLAILSRMSDISAELVDQKQLLLAKIDLIREHPHAALSKLSMVRDINNLPRYYQVQFHEMLANAYQSIGNTAESVAERIKLEKLLPDEVSQAHNRRALWFTLTTMPAAELDTLMAEVNEPSTLHGWMRLAVISRKKYDSPQTMVAEVKQWQAQYPQHPGHFVLSTKVDGTAPHLFAAPKHMALLLPLTGPLAGPGGAIKDGFMAANSSNATKVRLYDTNTANIKSLYQDAIANGADYIVGPLSKADVATVAAMEHPVPTLLLNDLDARPNEQAYQFGLSPSIEARQVADKARANGFGRALVIAPDGDWGTEIVSAFAGQWQKKGGRIVETLHYRSNDDMNAVIRDFLQITDSEARQQQLKKLLGRNVESTPSRRQDFDMIFLLAYPSKARQIMPLLNYYYAGDVPVFSTSAVYAGSTNVMKDRDLNGIIFCDMPWVFNHQMGQKNWPEQFNSYNRLYALGMDSYHLATQLNHLLLFPALGREKEGVFYLKSSQQIARVPAWGQFKQGVAQQIQTSML
jgi:outer membrane PBP1 activator LpoA protein